MGWRSNFVVSVAAAIVVALLLTAWPPAEMLLAIRAAWASAGTFAGGVALALWVGLTYPVQVPVSILFALLALFVVLLVRQLRRLSARPAAAADLALIDEDERITAVVEALGSLDGEAVQAEHLASALGLRRLDLEDMLDVLVRSDIVKQLPGTSTVTLSDKGRRHVVVNRLYGTDELRERIRNAQRRVDISLPSSQQTLIDAFRGKLRRD